MAAYNSFAGELANVFGKEWDRVQDQVDSGWKFLSHVPESAWRLMVRSAVDGWEGWPRNWVKAVKEIYQLTKIEIVDQRNLQACTYCNENGFFSGSKRVVPASGHAMRYSFVWRCKACSNWRGVLSEKITAAYPLEVKSDGYEVQIYGKPSVVGGVARSIAAELEKIGSRVNPKTERPAFLPYRDEGE